MIDLKSVIKLASEPHSIPLMRAIVFDGRNAIALAHSRDPQPWWAGVPLEQKGLTGPVSVPVDAIKAHFLRSRHLQVAKDHLHNGQGMRTDWDKKADWSDALTLLPSPPIGEPVMFDLELDALDRVLIATADADVRRALNGVLLDLSTGRIAGTDGARLHYYERKVPKLLPKKGQGALHVLLPRAAARWILYSTDPKVSVTIWGLGGDKPPLVLMRASDGLVYTAGLMETYPDFLRIVRPRDSYLRWAQLDPGKFSDAVAAMGKAHALSKPKQAFVTVQWAQQRVYAGSGPNFVPFPGAIAAAPGAAHVQDSALWQAFQPQYLADVADCVTQDARWCLPPLGDRSEPAQAALAVFNGDFAALVMPRRGESPPTDRLAGKAPSKAGKPAPSPAKAPARPLEPAKGRKTGPKAGKPAPSPAKVPAPAPEPAKAPETGPKARKPAPIRAEAPARPPEPAEGPERAPANPGKPAARGSGRVKPATRRKVARRR